MINFCSKSQFQFYFVKNPAKYLCIHVVLPIGVLIWSVQPGYSSQTSSSPKIVFSSRAKDSEKSSLPWSCTCI